MFERSKKAAHCTRRLIAVAAVPALFALILSLICLSNPVEGNAMYMVPNTRSIRVDDLEGNVFLTDGSAGLVTRTFGDELKLTPGLQTTVTYQNEVVSTISQKENLSQLLERLDIQPSPLEMMSVSFTDKTMDVCVGSEFKFYEHISTVSEHEIIYRDNSRRPSWYEAVIQEGHDGEYTEVYEIIYQDGQQTVRQLIDVINEEPVPAIVERGTKENFANNDDAVASIKANNDGSGVINLENGETVTFNTTRTMRGTAYTSGGGVGTRTASGTPVQVGVVAVDRSVIPLGTKVFVMSNDGAYVYGFAVAEDTGVRGNTIDLYMDTNSECIRFGVRECTVYILD